MESAVQQTVQPDLFGRHEACKATLAPPKTQVKSAFYRPACAGPAQLLFARALHGTDPKDKSGIGLLGLEERT